MYIGPNNVLYVVSGHNVDAVSPGGSILWQVQFPASLGADNDTWTGETAAFCNNMIYILALPNHMFPMVGTVLMAISDSGSLIWYKQLNHDQLLGNLANANMATGGGQLYLHTGDIVTVYNTDGKLLWHLSNVNAGCSVDEMGDLYTMPGSGAFSSVDAYYPNGSLKWEYGLGNDSFSQEGSGDAGVTYYNHTVYGTLGHALLALDENGSLLWKRTFNGTYVYMNLVGDKWYVQNEIFNDYNGSFYVYVVGADGNETGPSIPYSNFLSSMVSNNTIISGSLIQNPGNISLNNLDTYQVYASDILTGNEIWNYTISPEKLFNTTLDESNVTSVMSELVTPGGGSGDAWDAIQTNMLTPQAWYQEHSLPYGYEEVRNFSETLITPWSGGVYVSYWAYNYQYPFFFNQSECVYGGGLYALSNNGTLLWEKPIDSMVTAIAANNSTVYYSTENGNLSATQFNIAIGFALATIVYLFLRFFCIGAVARAKASLNKNEKRNQIYDYIVKNPGLTIYEIARGTKINMGTARYHVFILGMNHKIASYRTEGKYVRYFTNSNTFSRDEQLILSVMRREVIGSILMLLAENPCMSITQISKELDMQESAISRCIKELSEKGIITREPVGKKCLLDDIQREHINMAIKRMSSE
jgi:predicted transcriptional regulator